VTGDLLGELKRVTLCEEDALALRDMAMAQLSNVVRATRRPATVSALSFEAVARVDAEQTDDQLVHSSG
jgi:hypothetical protein